MRGAIGFAAALVGMLGSSGVWAQTTRATPGAIVNGKVVVRIHVVLKDEVTPYYPVAGLELRFYRSATDSTVVMTDAAGSVTTLLAPGEYRLVSARDAVWKGTRYSWSIPLTVRPGMPAIDLREPLLSAAMAEEEASPTTASALPGSRPSPAPRYRLGSAVADRQGFWIGLGLGAGSAGCDGCEERWTGLSGNFSLGGTLNDHVLLGAFFNGWTKTVDGGTLTGGTLTGGVRVYPTLTTGFFLTGGLGISNVELDTNGFGATANVGAGAMLGLGYDIRVGRAISVTPFFNGVGIVIDGSTANFFQAGFGVIWH